MVFHLPAVESTPIALKNAKNNNLKCLLIKNIFKTSVCQTNSKMYSFFATFFCRLKENEELLKSEIISATYHTQFLGV